MNVLRDSTQGGGAPAKKIVTPNAVAKARLFFGCSSETGVSLENQGGWGSTNSHWNRRNMRDDFMSAQGGGIRGMSATTLAVLEDTGYYTIDYANAGATYWGKNAGCNFLNKKCVDRAWHGTLLVRQQRRRGVHLRPNVHGLLSLRFRKLEA